MTQRELTRQVARATGETPRTVALLGFVPLTRKPVESEPWLDSVLTEISAQTEQCPARWMGIEDNSPA